MSGLLAPELRLVGLAVSCAENHGLVGRTHELQANRAGARIVLWVENHPVAPIDAGKLANGNESRD